MSNGQETTTDLNRESIYNPPAPLPAILVDYTIPKTIKNPFRTFTLREVSNGERLVMNRMIPPNASQAEKLDMLMRWSMYLIDGKTPNITSPEFESMWAKMPSKVATWIQGEVVELNTPTKEEDADFLSSKVVRVL